MGTEPFQNAVLDLLWLLDRGYPKNASVQITGDRYRLSREERGILFRGVVATTTARRRKAKLATMEEWGGSGTLRVDLYNVALILFNYRRGRPVFVSTDGYTRDVGGVHGAVRQEALFQEVLESLVRVLKEVIGGGDGEDRTAETDGRTNGAEVIFYLDAPVSRSREHAALLEKYGRGTGMVCSTECVRSADHAMLSAGGSGTAYICSGDSHVIDRSPVPVIDLARYALDRLFTPRIPDLQSLLPGLPPL